MSLMDLFAIDIDLHGKCGRRNKCMGQCMNKRSGGLKRKCCAKYQVETIGYLTLGMH